MPASRTAILALCLAAAHAFRAADPSVARRARSAPCVAAGFGGGVPATKKAKGAKKKAADDGGIGKGQTPLEKQWASFTQLVEEADDCAHDVFVRAEAAGDAPADRWRKVGRVAARGALGADAAISAQFALITWSATEIHRLALGAGKRRLEFAHTPADPAAFNVESGFEVELKHASSEELDQPRGALAVAARVADAGAIAPADVGFKPVRSPLAKEGELTHAVAGNSKNLAGMAKNAKVAASGKQGGMKGGYL